MNGFINHHLLDWRNLPPNQFGGKLFPSNIIFIIKSICSQKTGILPSNILYFPSTTTNAERNPSCLNNVQERGFQIFRIIFCELASWLSAWWRIESQKGSVDGLLKALPFFLLYCQKITHFYFLWSIDSL